MDVKMPDGTIIRNVPEGTTRAQLMARYGKTKQAQKPRAKGTGIPLIDNTLSAVNEFIIGAPKGIYNAAAAVTDPIAEMIVGKEAVKHAQAQRKAVTDKVRRATVSREMPVAHTAGQIAGSLAIPLPGKKLQEGGKIARGAYRAMQGAVGGAAVRDDDQDAGTNAAIGAAANVALPPILRGAANLPGVKQVSSAVGRAAQPVVNYLVGAPKQAIAAPARALAPLGRKAEARAARFKAAGVDEPTTAMVTRDPVAFKLERKLAQIEDDGDDLAQQIQGVEQSLVQSGRNLVDRMGGSKGQEAVGKAGQEVLDAKRGEMQQVTSRLYDKVREQRGDEIVGTLESLTDLMNSPDVTDNATFDQMRSSLSRRLARLGLADDGLRAGVEQFSLRGSAPSMAGAADDFAGRFRPIEAPDEFTALGVRRVGGTRPTRVRGPMDMTQQLRAWGGIQDQGGELRHLGIGNAPRRMDFGSNEQFLGKLVSDEGMTLDDAAERLWEAGYWNPLGPRPTPDDLLTRLRQEAMGERYFTVDDLDEVARFQGMRGERLRMQQAADEGAPFAEDLSRPAQPPQAPLSAQEEYASQSPRGVTLKQAEELRKFIRGLGSNAEPGVRMMRSQLIDALDDDVVNAVGDDAFKAARASARARFEEFSKTAAGRIADERIPADKLTQRLLSMPLEDLRSVKKSYLTGTGTQIERGTKAWKDLQAQGVKDLLDGAITDEGSIGGTKLLNRFKDRSANLRVLLDPADYKELRRLVLASRDAMVAPPSSSAYGSDTAPMIVNLLNGAAPKVKQSWTSFLKRVGAHGLAGAAGGPLANVALEAGRAGVGTIAEQRAASALARRIELARNPEAAARAIEALRKAAEKNPAARNLFERYGLAGAGAARGGVAAATANQ